MSFGTSAAARKIELQQGHDLRLCYQCHGAVDPLNNPIAPYRGAELCLRCHKKLGHLMELCVGLRSSARRGGMAFAQAGTS